MGFIEQAKVVKFHDGIVKPEREADEVLIDGEEISRDGSGRVVTKRQLIGRAGADAGRDRGRYAAGINPVPPVTWLE